jgi:hypothetical protein
MRTLGEAIRDTSKTLYKLREMIEKDDGSNPERSRQLKKAEAIVDGSLDGLESIGEWD